MRKIFPTISFALLLAGLFPHSAAAFKYTPFWLFNVQTDPVCGDGILDVGEDCDDGAVASATCDSDCSLVECGDGTANLGAGELCDDGNRVGGDGCSADCSRGYVVVEGDVMVRLRSPAEPRYSGSPPVELWEDGFVPLMFHADVTLAQELRMWTAIDEWEEVAPVNFIPRTNESNYLLIIPNAKYNWSFVGVVPDTDSCGDGHPAGCQAVMITSWGPGFRIEHELGHALGMTHEQKRPDRNRYIAICDGSEPDICEDNIQKLCFGGSSDGQPCDPDKGNEDCPNEPGTDDDAWCRDYVDQFELGPDIEPIGHYDFGSVMHYGQCDFSIGCPNGQPCTSCGAETIQTRFPNWRFQDVIGQRNYLSVGDAHGMADLYGCGDGTLDPLEECEGSVTGCDDDALGCDSLCRCMYPDGSCGNGVVEGDEECDGSEIAGCGQYVLGCDSGCKCDYIDWW